MDNYKVTGIVLRETNYKDYDKIITVLSKEGGLLSLKARGVRKKSSNLKAGCQLLAYSEFVYSDFNGNLTITESECIEMFNPLRNNIEKITLAFYFAEVTEVISQEDVPNPSILSILLNSLYALAYLDYPELQIKSAFEFRTLCMGGFMPDLSACSDCGSSDTVYFSCDNGSLLCADCAAKSEGLRIPVSDKLIEIMSYVAHASDKRFLLFRSSEALCQQFSDLSEAYLLRQFERNFTTLDMYKSLICSTLGGNI